MSRPKIEKYDEIIASYIEFKPVLQQLSMRYGNYPEAILNEIRAMNDHIARCYQPHIKKQEIIQELYKAEGHLKRLIYDTFKYLNIKFHDVIEELENKHFGTHWMVIDDGGFWSRYESSKKSIRENIENAKNNEGIDTDKAFEYYQIAYTEELAVYDLISLHSDRIRLSWIRRFLKSIDSMKGWILTTVLLTVVTAIIWELVKR